MRTRLATVVVVVALCCSGGATASADRGFTSLLGRAMPHPGVVTIPYFGDSFSFHGVDYPYFMVGTDPRTSRATTVVPTVIMPLRIVFADGSVSDPGTAATRVAASPLFESAQFSSGYTQYGDAVRRAMFWKYVAKDSYHVLLRPPRVLPTVTLNVPASDGVFLRAGDPSGPPAFGFHVAVDTGVVSASWFYSHFASLLGASVGPHELPIVLSRNVALSTAPIPFGNPTVGFHTAFARTVGATQQIQTAIWASYTDPYLVTELPGILHNTDVLSHEVSEWLHDPFLVDTVPAWQSPLPLSSAVYGCSSLLETGDPLSEAAFEVNGYQLQDEAFLSWFAHQVPSIGINGQYSLLGTFNTPAPPC